MTKRDRTRPRKTPAQPRSRALVDAILEGAARAFSAVRGGPYDIDDGAASPSINRIAELAGVSVGSLYQYFPGKDAIVAALIRRRVRVIHETLLDVIDDALDLPLSEAAARLVDSILEMKAAHMTVDAAILREALRHALTAEAFELDEELERKFAAAIERWRPRLRPDVPPDIAAHLLFQGLRAVMVVGAIARPELVGDARMRAEMVRLIVGYLGPEGEHEGGTSNRS